MQAEKNLASEQEIKETLSNFAQNFETEGFIVFTGKTEVNFAGRILVNYKGLRVIKFRKSQLHVGEFNEQDFIKICEGILYMPNRQEELLQALQERYPTSSFCIISGGIHQSTGHLASTTKGQTTVYIY